MGNYACSICHKPGARFRRYTSVFGILVISHSSETKPTLSCDEHKVKAGMDILIMNLILGWWAIPAFFWNIFAIIGILRGGRDVTDELEKAYAEHIKQISQVNPTHLTQK